MNRIIRRIIIVCILMVVSLAIIEIIVNINKKINLTDKGSISRNSPNSGDDVVNNREAVTQQAAPDPPDARSEEIPGLIYENINYFLELISEKKLEQAYNLLYPDFRMRYYPDFKSFSDYCNKYFSEGGRKRAFVLFDEKVDENTYVSKVQIFDDKTYSDKTSKPIMEKYFTTYFMNNDKEYRLAFDGFIFSENVNLNTTVGNIKININHIDRSFDKAEFYLDVFNGESQEVSILDDKSEDITKNITLITEGQFAEYSDGLFMKDDDFRSNNYILEPNTSNSYKLVFDILCSRKLKKINFNNIIAGQEVKKAEIDILK